MRNQLKLLVIAIVGTFSVCATESVAQTLVITLPEDEWPEWWGPAHPDGGMPSGHYCFAWCGCSVPETDPSCRGSDTSNDNDASIDPSLDGLADSNDGVNATSNTLEPVPALTGGMLAPTADVGSVEIKKANAQYSNSAGYSDSFSVGTSTNIGSSVSASSTPDYDVKSIATFAIGSSTIDQQIGTATAKNISSNNTISDITETANTITETEVSKDFQRDTSTRGGWWWWNRRNNTRTHITDDQKSTIETQYKRDILTDVTENLESSGSKSGTISGSFDKTFSADGNTNDVTVNGIGSDASIIAGPSFFQSDIAKEDMSVIDGEGIGAGTASGGASGNVGTTATVNANSSQFISSFGQAF